MVTLIITCAGRGTRAGFKNNKLLESIEGVTDGLSVVEKTFNACFNSNLFSQIILTASQEDYPFFCEKFKNNAIIVKGGETRFLSIKNALTHATGEVVLIHDGARPFVTKKILKNCIDGVYKNGSAITAVPEVNTVAKQKDGKIIAVHDKKDLALIQTPQGFYTKDIIKAYNLATRNDYPDDSSVYSEFIGTPYLCEGDVKNIKLTYKEDFAPLQRVGTGFDCHKLVEGRKLILGGIEIPHSKGLLGHSDADVLTHAIADALLSSLSLRDIGYHFPDSDDKYKGANSIALLKEVIKMLNDLNYAPYSISAVIMAEKPKLLNHIPTITQNLAKVLGIEPNMIGIGATTLEGLGFVGREEGICVQATAVVKPI